MPRNEFNNCSHKNVARKKSSKSYIPYSLIIFHITNESSLSLNILHYVI